MTATSAMTTGPNAADEALDFAYYLYDLFDLDIRVELSLRPDNKLGTDEEWDFAEEELRKALATKGLSAPSSQGSQKRRVLLIALHGAVTAGPFSFCGSQRTWRNESETLELSERRTNDGCFQHQHHWRRWARLRT